MIEAQTELAIMREPGERVVNHGSAKLYRFTSTLTFTPNGDGTQVTGRMEVELLGLSSSSDPSSAR